MKTIDLIDRSLLALEQNIGLAVKVDYNNIQLNGNDKDEDAHIHLYYKEQNWSFKTNVKTGVSLPSLKHIPKSTTTDQLIVLDYASVEMAEALKEKNIFFMDAAGNAFIQRDNIFIFIKGNPKPAFLSTQQPKRLFQETGLKILFLLLNEPQLVEKPHRDIAYLSNTSPASVSYVIEELKDLYFLIYTERQKRKLINLPQLLRRWAVAYQENLKPKYHRGYFNFKRLDVKFNLENIILDKLPLTHFGGELGFNLITQHLEPQKFIFYSNNRLNEFVQHLSIYPDKNGIIEIFDVFWNEHIAINYFSKNRYSHKSKIVSAILIYADLINSFDGRNQEAAKMIEKYVHKNIFQTY